MNDSLTQVSQAHTGKIDGWLKSSMAARLTGFASLGAKRIVLTWDSVAQTVSLYGVDAGNNIVNTYFSVRASEVERATFFHNNYFLRVKGIKYNITLRDARVKSATLNDVAVVADSVLGGVLTANADSHSEIGALQQMLDAVNPKTTHASKISSKSYVKVMTIGLVVVVVVVAIILVVLYTKARLGL